MQQRLDAIQSSLDDAGQVAAVLRMRDHLGMGGGEVIANPIPEVDAITPGDLDVWLEHAFREAELAGIAHQLECETGEVLDRVLYQDGVTQGKSLHGLETMQEQLDLFDSMPEADQLPPV